MPTRLSPMASKAGEQLRQALDYGPEYKGTCTRLVRARSYYQTVGKATHNDERRNDYAAWHASMLTIENRMRGLIGALPGGTVMFGQDSRGNWFAIIGRSFDKPKM